MEILKRIETQQGNSKKMKDIIDYLVEQGVTKAYVRELTYENDEIVESSSFIYLVKENRNDCNLENMNNIKRNDYEIDVLELKKILSYLTVVSINDTIIVTDKYAKNNLENGKDICFTKEELNWSKDNISHFFSLVAIDPFIEKL